MDILEWAKNEIELACAKERNNADGNEWNYSAACYESAYRAFESLIGDNHSGMSIEITKGILNKLIDGKPLTPIEDTPDIWERISYHRPQHNITYQCTRMSSLFKEIRADGTATFDDVNRVMCTYKDNPSVRYYSHFVSNIINQKYPIIFPYTPESKPYVCGCTELLYDKQNGDYDTLAIWYVDKPDGTRDPIRLFFKEGEDGFVRITYGEYITRTTMGSTVFL